MILFDPAEYGDIEVDRAKLTLGRAASTFIDARRRALVRDTLDMAAAYIHRSHLINNLYDRHKLAEEVRRLAD